MGILAILSHLKISMLMRQRAGKASDFLVTYILTSPCRNYSYIMLVSAGFGPGMDLSYTPTSFLHTTELMNESY